MNRRRRPEKTLMLKCVFYVHGKKVSSMNFFTYTQIKESHSRLDLRGLGNPVRRTRRLKNPTLHSAFRAQNWRTWNRRNYSAIREWKEKRSTTLNISIWKREMWRGRENRQELNEIMLDNLLFFFVRFHLSFVWAFTVFLETESLERNQIIGQFSYSGGDGGGVW